MKVSQIHASSNSLDEKINEMNKDTDLILIFGDRFNLTNDVLKKVRDHFPSTQIAGCSTSSPILGKELHETDLVFTSLDFSNTKVKVESVKLDGMNDSFNAGKELAEKLSRDDLAFLLVLSVGLEVNGSKLVSGIKDIIGDKALVAGGLAEDGDRFDSTFTLSPDGICDKSVVGIGFYGDKLSVSANCYRWLEAFWK